MTSLSIQLLILFLIKSIRGFTTIRNNQSCFGHQHNITTRIGSSWRMRITRQYATTSVSMSTTNTMHIETASTCVSGTDPDSANKINQDACFIIQTNQYTAGAVFDGHGKKGHELNSFLTKRMPEILKEKLIEMNCDEVTDKAKVGVGNECISSTTEDVMVNLLEETFEEVQEEARLNTNVPAGTSGTTCVLSVFDSKNKIIYTANVGDSRGILGMYTVNGNLEVVAKSRETTTKRDDERKRIQNGDGRIDKSGNVWYGPIGIAMTRSLGNIVMKRAGVIPTPETTKFNFRKELLVNESMYRGQNEENIHGPLFIILATDGIFDVLSNENVLDFVGESCKQQRGILQSASDSLVELAREKWQGGLPMDVRIDDTTCVLLRIEIELD
mmetsp:Transcript_9989/g.11619  ORF Transcript_9989/g.11619 Transcript_9989/m.11619 type:complete len:386 (-) Transcript_9989:27-1184(-)